MNAQVLKQIKQKVKQLPASPGVYLMKDELGNILYIGKAKNLKNRVSSYFVQTQKPQKVLQMVEHVFMFDYVITNSEWDALNLESNLIKKHQPFYNVLLKHGSGHAFIKINMKNPYPKLEITRQVKKDGAKYFGPYFSGISVKEVMQIIATAFMLRDCNLNISPDRPYARECLNYFLGNCLAPCTNRVNREVYLQEVNKVIDFLSGNLNVAREVLLYKMNKNAELENFEKAIELRDSLAILDKLRTKVVTELKKNVDIDVFGYHSNGLYSAISVLVVRGGKTVGESNHMILDASLSDGETLGNFMVQYYQNSTVPQQVIVPDRLDEATQLWLQQQAEKKVQVVIPLKGIYHKLLLMANANAADYLAKNIEKTKLHTLQTMGALEQLKTDLHLRELPVRMECYDISNLQGTSMVASMVVFINGEPAKNHYRKFKIKTVVGKNNDFESMKEVLTRRLKRLNDDDESFKQKPNLLVIDGGKGQLSSALEVLNSSGLDIDIISLAKQQEEVFVPFQSQSIFLNRNHYGLKLLQRIRDEAHRFAITFHRTLRDKKELVDTLSAISGVGDITAKKLWLHFQSLTAISAATVEELLLVRGVSKKAAQNIAEHFKNLAQ